MLRRFRVENKMHRWSFLVALCVTAACGDEPDTGRVDNYITAPTPETHTYFPIVTGNHALDCSVCHGAHDTFTQFDCIPCHELNDTVALHPNVPNFAYRSSSCYSCHPTGEPL